MIDLALLLGDVRRFVECESPSDDLDAVAASARVVAAIGEERLGIAPEPLVVDGVAHLRWRLGGGKRRVLLLAHHDTVWPIGSLASHPFSVDDTRLRGPGSFDMKAGLAIGMHALASLEPAQRDGVTLLVTGDEEIGSPTSRALIEDAAREHEAVLVLEAAADDGALKVARKGTARYRLRITGRAAHAGLEPEKGANAGVELARLILAIASLGDADAGTVAVPTAASAGTTTNTVPGKASLAVDVRAWSVSEQERVDRAIHALAVVPSVPGVVVEVEGGQDRPPLAESASHALASRAVKIARRIGLPPLAQARVGGASDGNLAAGVGAPTLDGLGAVGGGAHADDEYVRIDAIVPRAVLLRELIIELLGR